MSNELQSQKIAILAADGVERILRNAGAEVVDEEVVIDGQFTTSRSPADLPAFCPAIVDQFSQAGEHAHV
jgi:putative intracellular protease/amidase